MSVEVNVEDLKDLMVIAFVGLECMKDYCIDKKKIIINGYDAYRLSVVARTLRPYLSEENQAKMDSIIGDMMSQPREEKKAS